MTVYIDKLPREATGRCQRLDDNGNRCKRKAKVEVDIFADKKITGNDLWLSIKLCKKCAKHVKWFGKL